MTSEVEVALIGLFAAVAAVIPGVVVKVVTHASTVRIQRMEERMNELAVDLRAFMQASSATLGVFQRELTVMSTRLGVLEGQMAILSKHLGQEPAKYEARP